MGRDPRGRTLALGHGDLKSFLPELIGVGWVVVQTERNSKMAKKNLGQNVTVEVKGKKVIFECDTDTELGVSKSGKSINIATTNGAAKVHDDSGKEIGTLNFNFYKKNPENGAK